MGISTVSGPFRSKNGFQELVNGVWVPVAGGGGGNTTAVSVPITLGGYTPVEIVKPELGTILEFFGPIGDRNALDTGTAFTLAPTPGYQTDLWVIGISVIETSGVQRIAVNGAPYTINQTGYIAWRLTLTYIQDLVIPSEPSYAVFWADYRAYNP